MTQVCDLMCVLCVALNKREQCDFRSNAGSLGFSFPYIRTHVPRHHTYIYILTIQLYTYGFHHLKDAV